MGVRAKESCITDKKGQDWRGSKSPKGNGKVRPCRRREIRSTRTGRGWRKRRRTGTNRSRIRSKQGHWHAEHVFELSQALEFYRAYQARTAECDREIEAQLERFEDHSNGDTPAAKSGRRRSKGNAPRFDVWTHLYRMTGVDLTRIDGVDAYTALKVVSEIGADMTKWTSAMHFAS